MKKMKKMNTGLRMPVAIQAAVGVCPKNYTKHLLLEDLGSAVKKFKMQLSVHKFKDVITRLRNKIKIA